MNIEQLQKEEYPGCTLHIEKDPNRIRECLIGTACVYWGNGHVMGKEWVHLASHSPMTSKDKPYSVACHISDVPEDVFYYFPKLKQAISNYNKLQ